MAEPGLSRLGQGGLADMDIPPELLPLFIRAAQQQMPPHSPPIGYEDMSPAERAAFRMRGGPAAAAPHVQDTGELIGSAIQSAPMLMGPVGAAIADPEGAARVTPMAAPATAAVRAAMGQNPPTLADMLRASPAGAAEGESQADIKSRQQQYKNAGAYNGKVDGVDGPETQAAKAKFEGIAAERENARRAQELETLKATNASKQTEAEALRASNEAKALELADKQRVAKAQGNERLKTLESEVSPMSQIVRDYATPAGVGAGMGLGSLVRYGVVKGSNALSGRAANKAEALFERPATGIPNRTAKVNEFWRQGGAGAGEVPYLTTPASAPGKAVNEGAAELENLFQPNTKMQKVIDVGLPGAAMGESLWSQLQFAPEAGARLEKAIGRLKDDPSEANIKEYQAAKDNDAYIRALTNLGRGFAGGYGSGAMKWQRDPSRPSMEAADAERTKVDALIRAATAREEQASRPVPPELLALSAPSAKPAGLAAVRLPKGASRRTWLEGIMPPER